MNKHKNILRPIELADVKTIELQILKYFASFCEEHGLRYFLACGTLLGAIRHNGFIPWDDDIDVYMPRNDYMEFLELAAEKIPEDYCLITPYNHKDYIYTYAKLYDKKTVLIEFPENLRHTIGVYIDIFPVDGLPDVNDTSHFQEAGKLIYKNWLFVAQAKIFIQEKHIKYKLAGFAISIISAIVGKKYFFKKLDKKVRKYEFDKSSNVALITAGYGQRERIDKDSFSKYKKVVFENSIFNAPAGFHKYLSNLYGDYMQFPPENERVKRHNNEIYLNK